MKPGSVEDIVARLALWSKRAPKGLARVEFKSEFARRRVVNGLRAALVEAGLPLHEVELPIGTPAPRLVSYLLEQLRTFATGVVSISGFATAFPDDVSLADALQVFNFHRENLASPAVCQIWWMPTSFAEQFVRAVPDLNSWFMVRLHLTEVVVVPAPLEIQLLPVQPNRVTTNLEDARKRAANLVARFEKALEAGVSAKELRHSLAIPAVNALLEAGAEKEAQGLALTLAQKIVQAGAKIPEETAKVDFFISYANADGKWGEWLAWELENAGYTTKLQAWDFRPGANFVLEIQEAASACGRTIAVLSPHYLSSKFTAPEWAAAFAVDPTGKERTLVPVRVAPCELQGSLRSIVYIDLVDLDEAAARDKLLSGIRETRAKPKVAPEYPGRHVPVKFPTTERPGFPGALPSLWNIPHSHNPFFTGREKVLEQIHEALSSYRAAALSGLGGIGKTQTAVEYAYRHRNDYKAVFWVSAASELALSTSFVEMARFLNLPEKDAQNQNDTIRAVKGWLENNSNWLFILDNADEPESVTTFFPPNPKGHILLTSRAQVFDTLGIAKPIELEEMPPEEAVEFLFKRVGRDDNDPTERNAAAQLAHELGYLPLALEQAGAFILMKKARFQDYLTSYRKRGLELLEKARAVTGQYPKSVVTTWSLNFEQVEHTSAAAADLLRFSAFLNPDKIPLELATLGAGELGSALSAALANVDTDPLVLDEVLEPLTQFSLVHRDLESRTYDIHRLVQVVLKDGMDEPTCRLWAERSIWAVNKAFPRIEYANWSLCDRLLPHAKAAAKLVEDWNFGFQEAGRLLHLTGFYLKQRASFAEVEPLYQRALTIAEKALGPDHRNVAASLNNLAGLYYDQGRYAEAEPLFERALAIREKILGPDHPDVAASLNNLAGLRDRQGRRDVAESLYRRAIAIDEKVLGPEHPQLAPDLNNLAGLYYDQGKYAEAEPLFGRALAIVEKAFGLEHPDVATSLNNLAVLYFRQGEYTEAEPLFQQSLTTREKTLGPVHPDVATTLKNYAALLRKTNRETEAAQLEARAKAIRTKHA